MKYVETSFCIKIFFLLYGIIGLIRNRRSGMRIIRNCLKACAFVDWVVNQELGELINIAVS